MNKMKNIDTNFSPEAYHIHKVRSEYNKILERVLDKDESAIKEAKQIVLDLKEFDMGIRACHGANIYGSHTAIINVFLCILAHVGERDFVRRR